MDVEKPRTRRRKARRGSVEQQGADEKLKPDQSNSSSASEHSLDAPLKVVEGTDDYAIQDSVLIRSKWEAHPTPPIESTSPNEQFVMSSSPEATLKAEFQPPTALTNHDRQSDHSDLKDHDTLAPQDDRSAHTYDDEQHPDYHRQVTEECSLFETEAESCDLLDDKNAVPIHLPLSNELFTPAYCVHASSQCDVDRTEASDLVSNESKSAVCENHDESIKPLNINGEMDYPGHRMVNHESGGGTPMEVVEVGLSVLPNLESSPNVPGVAVSSSSMAPTLHVCAGVDIDQHGLESPSSVSPTTGKKRWKPKFSWPKGNLKLMSSTYEPSELVAHKQRIQAQDEGPRLISIRTKSPEKQEHQELENEKETRQRKVHKVPLACVKNQEENETKINSSEENVTRRKKRKPKKKRKASWENKENGRERKEVQEKRISIGAVSSIQPKQVTERPKIEENIFTDSEVEQLISDVELVGETAVLNAELEKPECEIRDATIKRTRNETWLKSATLEAFQDMETKLDTEGQLEAKPERKRFTWRPLSLRIEKGDKPHDQKIKAQKEIGPEKARTTKRKFPWSPKLKVGKGKLDVSGPAVDVPSAQVALTAPDVDVRLPDVSLEVPDASLSAGVELPEVSGEVSLPAMPASLEVDAGVPGVELDVTAPAVEVSGPEFGVDTKARVDVPGLKVKKPKFGFSFGKKAKKPKVAAPSVEVPAAGVDASLSLPGVDAGVSGAAELPSAEVSLPAKKRGFGFSFGGKGKVGKKVGKPKVGLDAGADASLEADVGLPEVRVGVDADADARAKAGVKGRGFKFPWSPKLKVGERSKVATLDVDGFPSLDISPGRGAYTLDSSFGPPSREVYEQPILVSDSSGYSSIKPTTLRSVPPDVFSPGELGLLLSYEQPVSQFDVDSRPFVSESVIVPSISTCPPQSPYYSPAYTTSYGDSSRHGLDAGLRLHYPPVYTDSSPPTKGDMDLYGQPKTDNVFDISSRNIQPMEFTLEGGGLSESEFPASNQETPRTVRSHFSLPRVFGSLGKKKHKPTDEITGQQVKPSSPDRARKQAKRPKKVKSRTKKQPKHVADGSPLTVETGTFNEVAVTPRTALGKSKDLHTRQTWHGNDEFRRMSQDDSQLLDFGEPPEVPPPPSGFRITPVLRDSGNFLEVRRRSTLDSGKRRPWSTVGLPPPGCVCVDDDYLFPDALTPTKIPSFRGSRDLVYNVPYMDDQALPLDEPEWPLGESRRTLLSQLSQTSDSVIHIAAEEESSIISLDDKENRYKGSPEKPSKVGRLFVRKSRPKSSRFETDESRDKSASRTKHRFGLKLSRSAPIER